MLLLFLTIFVISVQYNEKIYAYVCSIVCFCSFLFAINQIGSAVNSITAIFLRIIFTITTLILWIYIYIRKIDIKKVIKGYIYKNLIIIRLLLAFTSFCIILSVFTIPYNWDSMTYHLPRIFQWAQNHSLAHFATNDTRQISSPQLADIINLNVYLMYGTDRLLNLLQTFSYLTNGVLVFAIAKRLCAGEKWCYIGSILYYTLPIAFLEGFTTQNDEFTALIMLCIVYMIIPYFDCNHKLLNSKNTVFNSVILAFAVGLGYISKPSIGFGLIPFAIAVLIVCITRRDRGVDILKHILVAMPCTFIIIFPEMLKNYRTFGAFSPANVGARQLVGTLSKRYLLVNFYKTFTFNLPTVLINKSAEIIKSLGEGLALLLSVDINNPTISEDGRIYDVAVSPNYGCDVAPNPLIMWLLIITIVIAITQIKKNNILKLGSVYMLTSVTGFALFCVFLRWEPFISRYMISYFAVIIPAIVYGLDKCLSNKSEKLSYAVRGAIVSLCIIEFISLSIYQINLIKEQHDVKNGDGFGYFWEHSSAYEPCREIADCVNELDVESIGMIIGSGSYEYALIKLFEDGPQIKRILVDNETSVYECNDFIPDIIISYEPDISADANEIVYNETTYEIIESGDEFRIYSKEY